MAKPRFSATAKPDEMMDRLRPGVVALLLCLLGVAWFMSLPYRTLMGDDLNLLAAVRQGRYAGSFVEGLTETAADKYRPVVSSLWPIEIARCGSDLRCYVRVNLLVELLAAALAALLAFRLSRGRWPVAAAIGAMMLVSRFATYAVYQVIGLMEGLALLFLLGGFRALVRAWRAGRPTAFTWPLLWFFLLVHTHERFVVLAPAVALATLLAPGAFARRWARCAWAGFPLLIALGNALVKKLILGLPYFVGTGGHALAPQAVEVAGFMQAGLANLCGFNLGPEHLVGLPFEDAGPGGLAVALGLSLPLGFTLTLYVAGLLRDGGARVRAELGPLFLWTSALVLLVAGASVTIHQEHRWLYAPYTLVLLGLAAMLGRLPVRPRVVSALTVAALAGAVAVDFYYRRHLENVNFIAGMKLGDSARDILERTDPAPRRIVFVTDSFTVREWNFGRSTFFQTYSGDPSIEVTYLDTLAALPAAERDAPGLLVLAVEGGRVVDVTAAARQTRQ